MLPRGFSSHIPAHRNTIPAKRFPMVPPQAINLSFSRSLSFSYPRFVNRNIFFPAGELAARQPTNWNTTTTKNLECTKTCPQIVPTTQKHHHYHYRLTPQKHHSAERAHVPADIIYGVHTFRVLDYRHTHTQPKKYCVTQKTNWKEKIGRDRWCVD